MIGLNDIKALGPHQIIWDSGRGAVAGFGARRRSREAVFYFLKYRTGGGRGARQRWYTIGRHGSPWNPTTARVKASEIKGEIIKGADPSAEKKAERKAKTVSELCDLYLADAEKGRLLTRRRHAKKPSTLLTDRGRIERHIKPLLGHLPVAAVDSNDVKNFMHGVAEGETAVNIKTKARGVARVRGGKGTASRTVGLLGGIFTYAVTHQMRSDNPVHGVARFADGQRHRRIDDDEYAALGAAFRLAEETDSSGNSKFWSPAITAARLLALTGWRSGEVLGLRWSEIDLSRRTAQLGDTKTGASIRPLAYAACDVLLTVQNFSRSELVFAPTRGSGRLSGFPKMFARIAALGSLSSDITPHVMRHSFASVAADLGYGELTIAALVGHKQHSVTSRYVHSADAVLLAAADAVANRITELMGEPRPEGTVTEIRRRVAVVS